MDFNAIRKSKEESVNCENRVHFFCNSSYRIQVNFTQPHPKKKKHKELSNKAIRIIQTSTSLFSQYQSTMFIKKFIRHHWHRMNLF